MCVAWSRPGTGPFFGNLRAEVMLPTRVSYAVAQSIFVALTSGFSVVTPGTNEQWLSSMSLFLIQVPIMSMPCITSYIFPIVIPIYLDIHASFFPNIEKYSKKTCYVVRLVFFFFFLESYSPEMQ
jgi:hypothetical protein